MCSGYFIVLYNGPKVRRSVSRAKDELYQNNHNRSAYNDICMDNVDKVGKAYLKTIATIIVSMSIANVGPLFLHYKYGQHITLTALQIPFVDENSNAEYAINLQIQAFYALFFFMANISIEGCAILFGDGITLSSKLIQLRLEAFSKKLESNRCDKHQISKELITVLRQIHRVNGWIEEFFTASYWRYFIAPIIYTYAISLCVFCQYVVSWSRV